MSEKEISASAFQERLAKASLKPRRETPEHLRVGYIEPHLRPGYVEPPPEPQVEWYGPGDHIFFQVDNPPDYGDHLALRFRGDLLRMADDFDWVAGWLRDMVNKHGNSVVVTADID